MKKVKSIGKKVMSVGLAASLLLAPMSANKCFAANEQAQQVNQGSSKVKDTLKKAGIAGAGIGIYVLIWLLLCNGAHDNYEGYSKIFNENKEAITNFWEAHGDFIVENAKCITQNVKFIAIDICDFIKLSFDDLLCIGKSAYNILDTIGFKNIFSVIGGLYATNKLYNGAKWACNKVADWFKGEPKKQEKKESKKIEVNLNEWFEKNRDQLRIALNIQS